MKKRLLSVLLSAVMIGTIAGTAMPVMADDKEDIRVAGVVYGRSVHETDACRI